MASSVKDVEKTYKTYITILETFCVMAGILIFTNQILSVHITFSL